MRFQINNFLEKYFSSTIKFPNQSIIPSRIEENVLVGLSTVDSRVADLYGYMPQ